MNEYENGETVDVNFFGEWRRGRIYKNTGHPEVSEYYIKFWDGVQIAVSANLTIRRLNE